MLGRNDALSSSRHLRMLDMLHVVQGEGTMKTCDCNAAGAWPAGAVLAGRPRPRTRPRCSTRGEYLINGPVACGNCHNTRAEDMSFVPGKEFAGGFHLVDPVGIDAYSANITPDPDTGIGTWTDEEIITAIREGKTTEGKIIFPPMPVPTYNNMSDDDVKAIVAYLRTVKPVHNEVPESKYNIPQQAMPPAKGAPAPSPSRQGRLWRLHRHRARPLLRVPHAVRRPTGMPDLTKARRRRLRDHARPRA